MENQKLTVRNSLQWRFVAILVRYATQWTNITVPISILFSSILYFFFFWKPNGSVVLIIYCRLVLNGGRPYPMGPNLVGITRCAFTKPMATALSTGSCKQFGRMLCCQHFRYMTLLLSCSKAWYVGLSDIYSIDRNVKMKMYVRDRWKLTYERCSQRKSWVLPSPFSSSVNIFRDWTSLLTFFPYNVQLNKITFSETNLFMREDRNMTFNATLCLISNRVLTCPLSLTLLTLKFTVALLPTLIWG